MTTGSLHALNKGISHVTAVPVANVGDRVIEGGNEYTYCYIKTGLTALQGYAVSLSASTSYTCTMSGPVSDGTLDPFGVVQHNDIPAGEYGFILTKGFAQAVPGLNTGIALNDYVYLVQTTNTGNLGRISDNTFWSNVANQPIPIGNCVQAGDTAGSVNNATIYVFGK